MLTDVREMTLADTELIISYFHDATPEHLEMLGVDPTRLPRPPAWREYFKKEYSLSLDKRAGYFVLWLSDAEPVGFSTCDKIVPGEHASMHLHVTQPDMRQRGIGAECIRRSVDIYVDRFGLKRVFCEPNAFNTGPNRTLQKAGFKYLKTYMTVPGPLNFRQAVTRWVYDA